MLITYTIEPAFRVVYLHYSGKPRRGEWGSALERVIVDPRFEAGFNFYHDCRLIEGRSNIEYIREVTEVVKHHEKSFESGSWGIAVGNSSDYGMAKFAELLLKGIVQVKVLAGPRELGRWLEKFSHAD